MLLLLLSSELLAFASGCTSDFDCSANGNCTASGTCDCEHAWTGAKCATLNLLPMRRGAGLNTTDAADSGEMMMSWGGTVNRDNDGRYHMFVAQFINHCGFNQWATNSRIVHAVSNDGTADGTYAVKDVVWPVFAHNPFVTRVPRTGEWVMTFVANSSLPVSVVAANCSKGNIIRNSSLDPDGHHNPIQQNFMSVAKSPDGPWSEPVRIDAPFDAAVPPFVMWNQPNRNTNLVMSIGKDGKCMHVTATKDRKHSHGHVTLLYRTNNKRFILFAGKSMTGLWRRCCSPPQKYQPPGKGGESVLFAVHASDWRDISTWTASATKLLPELRANGYEDPHIWPDPRRTVSVPIAGGQDGIGDEDGEETVAVPVYHAVFHNMVGGWHEPEFNNTQVGAHAYSTDGGKTWTDTGVAFNLTVRLQLNARAAGSRKSSARAGAGGSSNIAITGAANVSSSSATSASTSTSFIQRERPHIVLDPDTGDPAFLVSAVTYSLSPTLPTCTIVQPIATNNKR